MQDDNEIIIEDLEPLPTVVDIFYKLTKKKEKYIHMKKQQHIITDLKKVG